MLIAGSFWVALQAQEPPDKPVFGAHLMYGKHNYNIGPLETARGRSGGVLCLCKAEIWSVTNQNGFRQISSWIRRSDSGD
jgi:hypothetical protein